jgi:hypothetical protein
MFDRNRNDRASETSAVPVEIAFADGTAAKGKLLMPLGKTVADVLNGSGSFIEFEPYGGERSFVAKAQLASVRLVGVPKVPNLEARLVDIDGFDPQNILGVKVGAIRDDIRSAYFALAKTYHPDRYATAQLPEEVRDYLAAMARRINAAHAALEAPQKKQAVRAEAVFTTPAR